MTAVTQLHPVTFEDFWRACPRRVGKYLAMKKWAELTSLEGLHTKVVDPDTGDREDVHYPQQNPAFLIAAMKEYRDTQIENYSNQLTVDIEAGKCKLIDGGKFTLHPATWLNKGRWADD